MATPSQPSTGESTTKSPPAEASAVPRLGGLPGQVHHEGQREHAEHGDDGELQLDQRLPDDVRDIYLSRAYLEAEVLRRLARAGVPIPADAREANAEIHRRWDASSFDIVDPDMRFHTALIDAARNVRTSRMYRLLTSEVKLCMAQVQGRQLLSPAIIVAEHERILELVEAGAGRRRRRDPRRAPGPGPGAAGRSAGRDPRTGGDQAVLGAGRHRDVTRPQPVDLNRGSTCRVADMSTPTVPPPHPSRP